jgi:hypothetical protein
LSEPLSLERVRDAI